MSQKLPVSNFDWIEDTSQYNKNFIKIYKEKAIKDIFSKLMFIFLKYYMIMKILKDEKLATNLHD